MQELIDKYNIKSNFLIDYFKINASTRLNIEQVKFLKWQEGKFIPPIRRSKYLETYMKEEIENFYTLKQLNLHQTAFCITTKCSLKCKYCNSMMQYFNKDTHKTYSFEGFKTDFDLLIDTVDILRRLVLMGGEPLLNEDFAQIIEYAAQNNKVEHILIHSNATIIPSDEVVEALKKYNKKVFFWLSDYSVNEQLNKRLKIKEIQALLNENNVWHGIRKDHVWMKDFGFNQIPMSDADTIKIRNTCTWSGAWQMLNGTLSHCFKSSAAKELGFKHIGKDDYINLHSLKTKDERRKAIINLYKKNVLQSCKYCYKTSEPVTPGEQCEIGEKCLIN